ncbi:MAG: nicotinate (nicotinamide) nucleotide adenylyltransferase [Opitutales bacterium]|jgi:nicotinate-nucleotide adenylyltransferase
MIGGQAATLGFLGGSFDPPHMGHLILARDALEQLGLDKVYLIPAAQSPLRDRPHAASYEHRVNLCRAVASGRSWLDVLDIEGSLPLPSYTVNTARVLQTRFPGAELVWLLGADQWESLPKWKDYLLLARMMRFGVASRLGYQVSVFPPPCPEASLIHARNIEISSTELRERLYCKLSIDHLAPVGVPEYIRSHSLYLHH